MIQIENEIVTKEINQCFKCPRKTKSDIGSFFDAATEAFFEVSDSLYVNLGYWTEGTPNIADAQRKLAERFGGFCGMDEGMRILDVGFGSGIQDILWIDQFNPAFIDGLNVSEWQVEFARTVADEMDCSNRLSYEIGDACSIPHMIWSPVWSVHTYFRI